MVKHSFDRSFIAHVRCVTPGLEGYLDCAKLVEKGGQAARVADDWMIVTSLKIREPHRFWFRCLYDESVGRPYYDIQSWSRRSGRDFQSRNRHLDCNSNGYAGLYSQAPDEDGLWKFMVRQEDDTWASMTSILTVAEQVAGRIYTRSNHPLQAVERQHVAGHWFAFAGVRDGVALDVELEILDIGEELMDDH